jgi:hypothetical protein
MESVRDFLTNTYTTYINPTSQPTPTITVLKASKIEKNGKILEPISFVKSNFKQQITNDLRDFFNITIELKSYTDMKKDFNNEPLKIIANSFTIDREKNITFTENNIKSQLYRYSRNLTAGAYNKVSEYTLNSEKYIFRESINSDIFDTFYENLKHIILYIIMCRYNNQIKLIPKPIYIGWNNNNIHFLAEAGAMDFYKYINDNHRTVEGIKGIEEICYKIYRDLYTINNVPNMNLCFKHCDMKPENIVLSILTGEKNIITKEPLLIDFGFSIFKIDDIDFIRPATGSPEDRYSFINKYDTDIYYNAIFDFMILLYTIIYKYKTIIFNYNFPKDKPQFILGYSVLNNIFYRIHKKYSPTNEMHYLQIANFIERDKIISHYDFKISPVDLLSFMGVDQNGKECMRYNHRCYYKKYIKYKNKYLALQNISH